MKNSAFIKLANQDDSWYVDVFTEYGVSFIKGSYIELLKMSGAKEYVTNDSSLENGVRYLASPSDARFKEKDVRVDVLIEGATTEEYVSRVEAFTELLNSGMIYLKIPSKKRVFKLVYTDSSLKEEFRNNRVIFTIDFKEPNPSDRIILE